MSVTGPSSWPLLNRRFHPPGTSPGSLIQPGCTGIPDALITMIQYSPDYYQEKRYSSLDACWNDEKPGGISWINISGNCTADMAECLGKHYNLHDLSLEDVLNQSQHPKIEIYEGYYFLVMYLLSKGKEADAHQVSIFLGRDYLITLQADEEDAFELVRNNIKNSKLIRGMGTDYLCYSICDALIDRLFPKLEQISSEMDELEEVIFCRNDKEVIEKIHRLKIKLLVIGKLAMAMQEVIYNLQSKDKELIKSNTLIYLRDCYDHTVQLMHSIESYREILNGIMDSYLSLQNNQMSQVIKVLTIIATIFIPLTFIVGVYGMNFNPQAGPWSMPELNWPYGYISVCAGMAILSIGMLIIFKRKNWI